MLLTIFIALLSDAICAVPLVHHEVNDTRPLCPCGSEVRDVQTRVVGGHSTGPGKFPYASGLVFKSSSSPRLEDLEPYCGGTLITSSHILTAAHCLKEKAPSQVAADVGDYSLHDARDGVLISARKFIKYPEYKPGEFHTDIGIVELERPVRWEYGVKAAFLPQPSLELQPGTTVKVYGWGRLGYTKKHPDLLNEVSLPVVDRKDCQENFETTIESSMICAGGEPDKDACIGDSGSGLVVRMDNEEVLCGVVSFGRKCALPHVPGVYTRVSSFTDWILEQTRTADCRPCIYGMDSAKNSDKELESKTHSLS